MIDLLEADCPNCAALCCVGLAFDKSDLFAIDKANGQACPNLDNAGECAIHQNLNNQGFGGCVQYTCNGAGQRVVQEVFGGQDWQTNASLLRPMLEAFSIMGRIHTLILLLTAAQKLNLPHAFSETQYGFLQVLNPPNGWNEEALLGFDLSGQELKIRGFLASLSGFVK